MIDSFPTRTILANKLNISQNKLCKIIKNNTKNEDYYYVELEKHPQDLLEKYDKPINKHLFKNSKKIKQINPITKQTVIFNSISDLYRRLGFLGRPRNKAIKDKVIYQGYLWEYCYFLSDFPFLGGAFGTFFILNFFCISFASLFNLSSSFSLSISTSIFLKLSGMENSKFVFLL